MCTFMSFFDVILGEIIHWSQQFVIGSLESMVRAASPESRLDMAVVYAGYRSSQRASAGYLVSNNLTSNIKLIYQNTKKSKALYS